jgi:xylulose-5-phosphate/fructose-6-phosphate phosphoketolase
LSLQIGQSAGAEQNIGEADVTQSATTAGDTAADNEGGVPGGETVPPRPYALADVGGPLSRPDLELIDAWWRAANYLAVGQIYLMDNPLLREELIADHVKPRLLGHFGTVPGLNLLYVHANRLIKARDLNAVFVAGPGHGGPGPNACAWLEGTYSEVYSHVSPDAEGMRALFRQFSFPGGVPSHCAPETPGSFHEGGELGYSLMHATGAALDNPDLVVFCAVGDGEAETGPLAASWHLNKFLSPVRDGAVLPVLALNQYKIANPTVLARIPEQELLELLRGYGYDPHVVAGDDPAGVHQAMAATVEACLDAIAATQSTARSPATPGGDDGGRPVWPMIVLRTPKGWTCPPVVDGQQVEGTFRAHQVPLPAARTNARHREVLADWLRSYRPNELFGPDGSLIPELRALAPEGDRRMSANPVANGGMLLRDLRLPDWRDYTVPVRQPGGTEHEATEVLGTWLRDVTRLNPDNFLVVAPDELASTRLQDILEVTGRKWEAEVGKYDEKLDRTGRVIEVLSEHLCEGLLEGYLLSGRHGLFTCYEAFIHIVDSMFNQHAKWLEGAAAVPWRRPLASLNYLLSSHVWRQDQNGATHQDPGFLDVVMNKKPQIVRVYLAPDANTLLSTYDHCLRSRQYVNVVVAGKQSQADWLSAQDAELHCTRGAGIWEWAGTERPGTLPDVVLACAGDVPTLEVLAAASILRAELPGLRVRVVNVVDLMRLLPESDHPHGLSDREYDALFTEDRPVIFAFHGYPSLVHRLAYQRRNHAQLHVRGYKEEGTTTTPFDMVMMNDLDRYHLVMDVIDRVDSLGPRAAGLRQRMADARLRARQWTREHGEDIPEVADWKRPG